MQLCVKKYRTILMLLFEMMKKGKRVYINYKRIIKDNMREKDDEDILSEKIAKYLTVKRIKMYCTTYFANLE